MKKLAIILLPVAVLSLSACSGMNDKEQRALSGGAIGAGGGAVMGALLGNPLMGAAVGGAVGAAAGALMDKSINQ